MKILIALAALLALGACSKSAPSNSGKNAAISGSEDGIKQDAKSIDAAADEAAALVEEETGEEIKAYDNANADTDVEADAEGNSEDNPAEGQ